MDNNTDINKRVCRKLFSIDETRKEIFHADRLQMEKWNKKSGSIFSSMNVKD